eukprot:SAG31_NODE_3445_length_4259_cov_4.763702_1_plen_842_part_10
MAKHASFLNSLLRISHFSVDLQDTKGTSLTILNAKLPPTLPRTRRQKFGDDPSVPRLVHITIRYYTESFEAYDEADERGGRQAQHGINLIRFTRSDNSYYQIKARATSIGRCDVDGIPSFGFEWCSNDLNRPVPTSQWRVFVLGEDERLSAVNVVQCSRCVHTVQFSVLRADGSSRNSAVYGTPYDVHDSESEIFSVAAETTREQHVIGLLDAGTKARSWYSIGKIRGIAYLETGDAKKAHDGLFAEVSSAGLRYTSCSAGTLDGIRIQMRTAPTYSHSSDVDGTNAFKSSRRIKFEGTGTDSFAMSLEHPCILNNSFLSDESATSIGHHSGSAEYGGGLFLLAGSYNDMTDNVVLTLLSKSTAMLRHQNGGKFLCAASSGISGKQFAERLVWKKRPAECDASIFTLMPQHDESYGLLLPKNGLAVTVAPADNDAPAGLALQPPHYTAATENISLPFSSILRDEDSDSSRLDRVDIFDDNEMPRHHLTCTAASVAEAVDGLLEKLHRSGLGLSRVNVATIVLEKVRHEETAPETAQELPDAEPPSLTAKVDRAQCKEDVAATAMVFGVGTQVWVSRLKQPSAENMDQGMNLGHNIAISAPEQRGSFGKSTRIVPDSFSNCTFVGSVALDQTGVHDDEVVPHVFTLQVDGKNVWTSDPIDSTHRSQSFAVALTGARLLTLCVSAIGVRDDAWKSRFYASGKNHICSPVWVDPCLRLSDHGRDPLSMKYEIFIGQDQSWLQLYQQVACFLTSASISAERLVSISPTSNARPSCCMSEPALRVLTVFYISTATDSTHPARPKLPTGFEPSASPTGSKFYEVTGCGMPEFNGLYCPDPNHRAAPCT